MSTYTSKEDFDGIYSTLFSTFATGRTKRLKWRKWQLKQFWWMIVENEEAIINALNQDLNRHTFESMAADLRGIKDDLIEHLSHLEEWTADSIPDAGFIFGTLGKARIRKEPLGVALIIGAWNFPFLLLLQPMIAAITAGCCVLLKPSELSKASQQLLSELIPRYMDTSAIGLVTGGPAETSKILERRFNHIFFTGSAKVAKFITAAAAKHLTPTVLELGGQGPAIVTASANVDLAAKRIAYGKFMNAGQICLSINHVFADPLIYDEFVERLGYWMTKFMDGSRDGYCSIVNERNFDRLSSMLERSGGSIASGGKQDRESLFFEPTIVSNVTIHDSLLSEELFGPILPVIKADYKQAYKTISSMEHPLAIYIFSKDQTVIDEVLDNTNSGGVTVNDVVMHAGVPNAPFGGVGDAGYGSYHGIYGFLSFSHQRVVVAPPTWLESIMSFRYPPYDLKHVSKIAVSMPRSLKFRRDETMEDQVLRNPESISPRKVAGFIAKSLIALALVRMISQRREILQDVLRLQQQFLSR